jgi:hypothetical protein
MAQKGEVTFDPLIPSGRAPLNVANPSHLRVIMLAVLRQGVDSKKALGVGGARPARARPPRVVLVATSGSGRPILAPILSACLNSLPGPRCKRPDPPIAGGGSGLATSTARPARPVPMADFPIPRICAASRLACFRPLCSTKARHFVPATAATHWVTLRVTAAVTSFLVGRRSALVGVGRRKLNRIPGRGLFVRPLGAKPRNYVC